MSQWPSTGVLGHMGMHRKCFLSVLPNFEQCVKCILVTAKDTYGHWDVCQMEYRAKEVLWFALEQVMTCWKEEVKAVWWVFKLASKWHGGFPSKVQIFATWVFRKAFICSDQLFSSRDLVLKANCLSPVMTRAAFIVDGDVAVPWMWAHANHCKWWNNSKKFKNHWHRLTFELCRLLILEKNYIPPFPSSDFLVFQKNSASPGIFHDPIILPHSSLTFWIVVFIIILVSCYISRTQTNLTTWNNWLPDSLKALLT